MSWLGRPRPGAGRGDRASHRLRPDGQPVPDAVTPPRAQPIEQLVAESGVDVSAETCVPLWDGQSMDLAMAVAGLRRDSLNTSQCLA